MSQFNSDQYFCQNLFRNFQDDFGEKLLEVIDYINNKLGNENEFSREPLLPLLVPGRSVHSPKPKHRWSEPSVLADDYYEFNFGGYPIWLLLPYSHRDEHKYGDDDFGRLLSRRASKVLRKKGDYCPSGAAFSPSAFLLLHFSLQLRNGAEASLFCQILEEVASTTVIPENVVDELFEHSLRRVLPEAVAAILRVGNGPALVMKTIEEKINCMAPFTTARVRYACKAFRDPKLHEQSLKILKLLLPHGNAAYWKESRALYDSVPDIVGVTETPYPFQALQLLLEEISNISPSALNDPEIQMHLLKIQLCHTVVLPPVEPGKCHYLLPFEALQLIVLPYLRAGVRFEIALLDNTAWYEAIRFSEDFSINFTPRDFSEVSLTFFGFATSLLDLLADCCQEPENNFWKFLQSVATYGDHTGYGYRPSVELLQGIVGSRHKHPPLRQKLGLQLACRRVVLSKLPYGQQRRQDAINSLGLPKILGDFLNFAEYNFEPVFGLFVSIWLGDVEAVRQGFQRGLVDVDFKFNLLGPFGEMVYRWTQNEEGPFWRSSDLTCATPLMYAAVRGHADIVRMLVQEFGANLEATNSHGQTALFVAVKSGYDDAVEQLLQLKANVDAVDENGETPLIAAVKKWGDNYMVELLLSAGANPYLMANDGTSAARLLGPSNVYYEDSDRELYSSDTD